MSGSGSVSIVNATAGTISNAITVNSGGQSDLGRFQQKRHDDLQRPDQPGRAAV